ncbi:MAG: glutamate/gamma-aminobutyrate family transporter YjeM, partial [Streptococcaceae bacterium]|jgi:hypothetical protein|nr:glutamate/gamma-aminobutyrate family transporter YjeM [Streptococcaceae bacterium]
MAIVVVGFSIGFTVIQPILQPGQRTPGLGAYGDAIVMIMWPALFALIAYLMMNSYARRHPEEYAALTVLSEDELAK